MNSAGGHCSSISLKQMQANRIPDSRGSFNSHLACASVYPCDFDDFEVKAK